MDFTKYFNNIANFYFSYIVCADDYFSADIVRKVNLLYPPFKTRLNLMLDRFEELNSIEIPKIFETYRSLKRQKYLYQENKTSVSTSSYHHFGLASDIVFIKDGKITWEGNYKLLTDLSIPLGLFKTSYNEQCHFEYLPDSELQKLRVFMTNKVKLFQQNYKLKVDGIIGPVTKSVMFQHYWGKDTTEMQLKVRQCNFTNNLS